MERALVKMFRLSSRYALYCMLGQRIQRAQFHTLIVNTKKDGSEKKFFLKTRKSGSQTEVRPLPKINLI